MSTGTLVSVEEYVSTTYDPDCEYVDGRLLDRNIGESDHAGIQGLLIAWLLARQKQFGIHVFPELRIQVAPERYRVPDITVTTQKISGRILRVPPFLCVEILSPEDRASRMEEKIDDYLRFGIAHIWLIDPRSRRAWSYGREGQRVAATLLTTTGPEIKLPLEDLFAQLDAAVDFSDN
jgi:Uma2 family endonuclease